MVLTSVISLSPSIKAGLIGRSTIEDGGGQIDYFGGHRFSACFDILAESRKSNLLPAASREGGSTLSLLFLIPISVVVCFSEWRAVCEYASAHAVRAARTRASAVCVIAAPGPLRPPSVWLMA
jgi:hypothetical protein